MFNMFCLYSDLFLANILIIMKFLLLQFSRLKKQQNVYFNTAHLEGPKMTVRCISDELEKVKKANNKWTFENIFKRLKATCFSPSRDLSTKFDLGSEKIAAHFQVIFTFF